MDCEGNIFENNYCNESFPFELIIVISIISARKIKPLKTKVYILSGWLIYWGVYRKIYKNNIITIVNVYPAEI